MSKIIMIHPFWVNFPGVFPALGGLDDRNGSTFMSNTLDHPDGVFCARNLYIAFNNWLYSRVGVAMGRLGQLHVRCGFAVAALATR